MHFATIFKLIGSMLLIFSLSLIPPFFVAIIYNEINTDLFSFIIGFILTSLSGFALWFPLRKFDHELKSREGFLFVALIWVIFCFFAAIPFYLFFYPNLSLVDALFESVSGLTTTGATVFAHLDAMPKGILYYRQQLHMLGGLGIILLAIAILPMLEIGGMQLYQAEASGPLKTEKIHPRLKHTTKWLWYIYFSIIALCALSFKLAGMNLFDAIGESYSAVSTGGFSLHDASLGYYHSNLVDVIAIFFMILGSINFGLHYQFMHKANFKVYLEDDEFCVYIKILLVTTILFTLILVFGHYYPFGKAWLNSLFSIVSMSTTTGYNIVDFSKWPSFLPYLIMFITIMGGCGASAAGGLKVIRCLILYRQANCELKRLIHPQGYVTLKLNGKTVPESVLQSVWGFFSIFLITFLFLFLLLKATGLSALTSFSALAACISNTGTGIGGLLSSFDHLNDLSKWILIIAMLIGRLEIFTILVIFTPSYWKK